MEIFSGMIIVRSKEQNSEAKPVDSLCQKPANRYQQLVSGESS